MKNCTNINCKQQNPQSIDCFSLKSDKKDGRSSRCKSCINEHGRNRPKTAESLENARKRTAEYRLRHPDRVVSQRETAKKDPNFKEKARLAAAKYRANNPDKVLESLERAKTDPELRARARIADAKSRVKHLQKRRKSQNERNSIPENRIKRRESAKKSRKKNSGKDCAKSIRRYASKIQRMPKWLSKEQIKQMQDTYVECEQLQWLNNSSDPLQVDHIFPLQGENVSGLHVPWNLQILPREVNVKKSNDLLEEDTEYHKKFVISILQNKKPGSE